MNLLITGAWTEAKQHIEDIERLGHRVCFMQQEADELPCEPAWVEGVVCNGLFLSHPIEQFTRLRYIQLTSAGFDRVPMDYVKTHEIEIFNARGVYSTPMAEFAISGVLQLYKQAKFFHRNQLQHRWEKHRQLQELAGKTVCIVGCGSVGTECAKRFQAFDSTVVGIDVFPVASPYFSAVHALEMLDEVLPQTDILVLTLPLTDETRHLMDASRLSQLKSTAVIVNIARGAIIGTEALISVLKAGRIQGAVLDVYEEEPLPDTSELWDMDNVILTPHNSFVGEGNGKRLSRIIMNNIANKQI